MGTSAFDRKNPNTDFTDCADFACFNPWNPHYYHLKSAKASQIFRVAFGYQCESVCICGSVFLVAASLRQEIRVGSCSRNHLKSRILWLKSVPFATDSAFRDPGHRLTAGATAVLQVPQGLRKKSPSAF
jgi:hypothetical protein